MISNWFNQTSDALLNVLLPPRCVNCGSSGSWLCRPCAARIDEISPPVCSKCGYPAGDSGAGCPECARNDLGGIDGIRSAAFFEGNPIHSAIVKFKYHNHKVMAAELALLLAKTYRQYSLNADIIVPVPLHLSRWRERGYNQSELLARHLARLLELPLDTASLRRIRATRSQMTLGAVERYRNVAGAFQLAEQRQHKLADKTVLLVDDVWLSPYITGGQNTEDISVLKINNTEVFSF